jgi:hypothetical protein
MLPTLGSVGLSELPRQVSLAQAEGFATVMRSMLGVRTDAATGMAAFVAAMSASAELGVFRVPELVKLVPGFLSCTPRELRYAVDKARWQQAALRQHLVAAAPLSDIVALVIEHHEICERREPIWDVLSLHALGPSWTVPVGWQRYRLPPPDRDGDVIRHADCEHAAVRALLRDYVEDLVAVAGVVPGPAPPLFTLSSALGENFELRQEIAQLVPEYLLAVEGTYCDHRLREHPYEPRNPEDQLADILRDRRTGQPSPMPRQVLTGSSRRSAEYAVACEGPRGVSFAIGHPHVAAPQGVPLGRRPEQRITQLAELAGQIEDSAAATRLRLAAFRHNNDAGWQRAALLMSAYHAYLQGLLEAPGEPLVLERS